MKIHLELIFVLTSFVIAKGETHLPLSNLKACKSDIEQTSTNRNIYHLSMSKLLCCSRRRKDTYSSSEEEMEKPWKEVKSRKKYKQTTLNFAPIRASSSTKKVTGAASGPITRRSVHRWTKYSDRDTETYRDGYPGQKDNPKLNANLLFYTGQIASSPDGALIDDIHSEWRSKFELLERHHGYIQWLFPIREDGMNWKAQPLQLHEAKAIVSDPKAHRRVIRSYEMMLHFYGMKLTDRTTGEIERSDRWKECYQNLNFSGHNYLRITRILKSLGEFELEHLKKPWLNFFIKEIFEEGQLRRTLNSLQNYWIGTLKNDADREELHNLIDENT